MAPVLDAVFRVARPDPMLASVRYRALAPAVALTGMGARVAFSTGAQSDDAARVCIAVKPLAEADATWVMRRRDQGDAMIVDLCDNVFIDGYGGAGDQYGARFARTVANCTVTVPTTALRDVVMESCGLPLDRVLLVPDIVETPDLIDRQLRMMGRPIPLLHGARKRASGLFQRARRTVGRRPVLLWFGNHGAAWGRFGLSDLMLMVDALARAAQRHRAVLWVVSNNRSRFEDIRHQLPIDTRYFDWTPHALDGLLAAADVCLVPNSLDAFARTKSANRALKALAAGVPVVATPTSAYRDLEDCMWLGDFAEGIGSYLDDDELVSRHLSAAGVHIARDYSLEALGAAVLRASSHAQAAA